MLVKMCYSPIYEANSWAPFQFHQLAYEFEEEALEAQ